MKGLVALHRTFAVVVVAAGLAGTATAARPGGWFDGASPAGVAHDAVELLRDAASHGLDPRDYDAAALDAALARAAPGVAPDAAERLEQQLTTAMLRYLNDLHAGRVEPGRSNAKFHAPAPDAFDAQALLAEALASRRMGDLARNAAPRLPQYERVRGALLQHRLLVGHPAWRQGLPPLPSARRGERAKLEPGQTWAGLAMLARRLDALGDLPTAAQRAPARYEASLVEGVRAFQRRHGLIDDGVIGAATLAQLQVPPAARVRQLELALERLRWTPLLQQPRMIVINIPEFVLRAYEVRDGDVAVRHAMKVIVGKAMDKHTPLIEADLRYIEFSPYWNVPHSIARDELVPRLRRDPGYWTREGFEFIAPDGRVETALSPAGLEAVLARRLRIRQRPGPHNALGDIKFVFPNHDSIYLHHTPATGLFERARRDFSHGCIRVERPVDLATFVLHDMPQWDEARVREAMGQGVSATLRLAEPVRVLIAYGTALVKDDRVHFYDDLYGHDRALDTALRSVSLRRQSEPLTP